MDLGHSSDYVRHYTEMLYSSTKVPRFCHLNSIADRTERAHEVHSGVGLGSGAVHITGLVKQYLVRLV